MAVSDTLYYVLSGIVTVALLLPSICVAIRRLHDTGRGGGWCFIALIPLVGAIWLLVLMLLPGEPEANRFGDVPTTSL
jgi:inner membrane protein yhaI